MKPEPAAPSAPAAAAADYPRYDPADQPCRALLTEIVRFQGMQPARSRSGREALDRAKRTLLKPLRGRAEDERACAKALGKIHEAIEERLGADPFTDDPAARALWERLDALRAAHEPRSGTLAGLED